MGLVSAGRAHPRSRGENVSILGPNVASNGSSPLTRGKPSRDDDRLPRGRLIPAHAGKTPRYRGRERCPSAHPRSRGENGKTSAVDLSAMGSSPLTRGKPRSIRSSWRVRRLIPAHAGKTHGPPRCLPSRPAHPRSRGENTTGRPPRWPTYGSSPLTRGKPGPPGFDWLRGRLIPAHAGKTVWCASLTYLLQAHPRSRGENLKKGSSVFRRSGSSPLTRGKLPDRRGGRKAGRLIPAHAGKTLGWSVVPQASGAHPRSRGENRSGAPASTGASGSSPLTRGKRSGGVETKRGARLIPAHAGKTESQRRDAGTRWAHPRSRGENELELIIELELAGSSPLTRGKRRMGRGP